MSNAPSRPRPPAARPTGPRNNRPTGPRNTRVMPVAIAVVAALAAISVAIGVATGGDEGTRVAQTRVVEVTGRALPPMGTGAADPALGRAVPDVRGEGFDGQVVELTAGGGPELVVFLAHWCSHCRAEVPVIVDWMAGGGPQGVELTAVSTGVDRARPNYPPSEWLEREDWTVPTIADDADGTAAAAYGLTGYPYFVAVTADGKVAARASGEQTVAQLQALAEAARG